MLHRFVSRNTERLVIFLGGILISAVASGLIEKKVVQSTDFLVVTAAVVSIATVFLVTGASKRIHDLADKTEATVLNKPYEEQADMYRDLAKYIDEKGVKNAILIQYSGRMAVSLLRKLASKGANITLYVKCPKNAISQMQTVRIENGVQQLRGELQVSARYKLTVYEYDVPASMRAVKIDDKVLAIGWYMNEYAFQRDPDYPQDQYELSGHDVPGMLFYSGSSAFAAFDKMFTNQIKNFEAHYKISGKQPILKAP